MMNKILLLICIFTALGAGDRPFVTVKFHGQLGNQMFEIAAATSHALDCGYDILLPELSTVDKLGIPKNKKLFFFHFDDSELPRRVLKTHREPSHRYSSIPVVPDLKIVGYFQSEKYFLSNKGTILSLFAPHPKLKKEVLERYGTLLAHPCTVGLHVRTYNKEDPLHNSFYNCSREYVKSALKLFPVDAKFIVCSDDIPWCKKHLSDLSENLIFIEGNDYPVDFWLLAFCKNQIISSSTFSWWAAYLNENPDKIVVAPKNWLKERFHKDDRGIIPEGWVILNND